MSYRTEVRVTVVAPRAVGASAERRGACELLVVSDRPLPRAPHVGTVRVAGTERTATGTYPCRLLKRYSVERAEDTPEGVRYAMSVDLADEAVGSGASYAAPGVGVRRVDEPVEQVCKRIAGIFGRFCEGFRPPSVVVQLGE